MKYIIASGSVIIEDGKLIVIKDYKDDFYKLPGGRVEYRESLEDACIREVEEELNAGIKIIKPLNPLIIYKNPQTDQEMTIILIHYLSTLENKSSLSEGKEIKELSWLSIKEIKNRKYEVSPNISYLIEKGDIK